jgi:hypothetical protein
MKKSWLFPVLFITMASSAFVFWGCSKDDDSTNPNSPDKYICISMKAGAMFTYNRWDLDTSNNKVASSLRNYVVNMKGNNGLILGIWNDWYYRIGTDGTTMKKDTLFIRTENATIGTTAYTKNLQVYGFLQNILKTVVTAITAKYPVTPPSLPGATWDNLAVYADNNGNPAEVGSTWNIGSANGIDLTFNIGIPVVINVKCLGKLEAKNEAITVDSKSVNTWKTSATITMSLFTTTYTIKMYTWFSGDPSAQVKMIQESTVINILSNSLPFNGEQQELVSYQ